MKSFLVCALTRQEAKRLWFSHRIRTVMKCGAKLIWMTCLLVALTGCQRHILIDLVNESGDFIQVVDYSNGRTTVKTIANNSRLLLLSPVPLVIEIGGKTQQYFIRVPNEYLQSKFRGRVASLELGRDGKLYLLRIDEKPPTSHDDPQPAPFPIAP